MKIEYDPAQDLLNIEFIAEEAIAESCELDGVIIDYSEDRRIIFIHTGLINQDVAHERS